MTYAEQLLDSRWLAKREEILERDRYGCKRCAVFGRTGLHVHHLAYYGGLMAWEYPDRLLITLCELCHTKEHQHAQEAALRLAGALRRAGADNATLERLALLVEEICERDIYPAAALVMIELVLQETWGRHQ